jgi:hypothetical protein
VQPILKLSTIAHSMSYKDLFKFHRKFPTAVGLAMFAATLTEALGDSECAKCATCADEVKNESRCLPKSGNRRINHPPEF